MPSQLKILILEDSEFDAELIRRELKHGGLDFVSKEVSTKKDFQATIRDFRPDIILADHSLPQFNSKEALDICKKLNYNNPFILVTGSVSEEFAVHSIQNGADDYILKGNLTRLPSSIINAHNKRKAEREKRLVQEKLIKSESQIRNFATHLSNAIEEERAHIAREMHDELGQQLAAIKMDISFLKKEKNIDETSKVRIDTLIKSIDGTIQSMRKIATRLRPGILDTLGLAASIEWLGKEFEKKTSVKCIMDIDHEGSNVEKKTAICFFRVCQETLTNIIKHANASSVSILLKENKGELLLKINDNGKGIIKKQLENPFSMGLIGMKERANIIKGELQITSEPGKGTTVCLKAKLHDKILDLNFSPEKET